MRWQFLLSPSDERQPIDAPMFVKGFFGLGCVDSGRINQEPLVDEGKLLSGQASILSERWFRAADRHVGRKPVPQDGR